jgi:hypothetical protein
MANFSINLPVPAGDGVGASVDTSSFGRIKTFILSGEFGSATVTIEASADGGTTYAPLITFTRAGKKVIEIAASRMRTRVRGFNPVKLFTVEVDVAGNDNGGFFVALPLPAFNGLGAIVDTSSLGNFTSIIVTGNYPGATITLETSEDGVDFVECAMFANGPRIVSKDLVALFMRVKVQGRKTVLPFTGSISVGATNDTVSLAIGTVVSGGTPGSVLFIGAGGTLAQDNANFFWDDAQNALVLGHNVAQSGAVFNAYRPSDNTVLWFAGDTTINNLETVPKQIRYFNRAFLPELEVGDDETAGLYIRQDPTGGAGDQKVGIYGEVTSNQVDATAGAFMKIIHFGAGDAIFCGLFASGAVAFESSSFTDGSKGIISTLQSTSGGNSVLLQTLWESTEFGGGAGHGIAPIRGALVCDQSPALGLTIRKWFTSGVLNPATDGQRQIRIVENDFARDRFAVFNDGQVRISPLVADAGNTIRNSPAYTLRTAFWTGAASQDVDSQWIAVLLSASAADLQVRLVMDSVPEYIFTKTALDLQTNNILNVGVISGVASNVNFNNNTLNAITSITLFAGAGIGLDMQGRDIVSVSKFQQSVGGLLGFFGGAAAGQATVVGAKGGNAALGSLMAALSGYGLVIDSTTP